MSAQPKVRSLGEGGRGATGADVERHVHIVLLGLMGAGKSIVGRLVANELGRPFVDSDSIVELRTGHLPPEVVRRSGLDALHEVELDALRHVMAQRDSVVFAAAASVIDGLTPAELDEAGRSTWFVWLEASPKVLAERVRGDRHERPLLGDRPERVLAEHHDRRARRARDIADEMITTDGLDVAAVAARVCDAWRAWSRARAGDASRS